jgi:hypothetical protein
MVNSVGKNAKGKKVDKALDLTFPASDPPAFGTSTRHGAARSAL